jgi:hypothetical protein
MFSLSGLCWLLSWAAWPPRSFSNPLRKLSTEKLILNREKYYAGYRSRRYLKPRAPLKISADLMRTAGQLSLFLLLFILPVAAISAESDQQLAAKIAGVWVDREMVYYSDVEVQTTYRADGAMSRLAKFNGDRRRYKISVQGRWKVDKGQLISVCPSFSGQTEDSINEIIAVTENMLLLRAADGTLSHYIRK